MEFFVRCFASLDVEEIQWIIHSIFWGNLFHLSASVTFFLRASKLVSHSKKEDMYFFFLGECGRSGSLRRRKNPHWRMGEKWLVQQTTSNSDRRKSLHRCWGETSLFADSKVFHSSWFCQARRKSKRIWRMKHPCIHYYFSMRSDFIKINIL